VSQDLVIVESPAKARTIEGYLGGKARVLASYGHVRDLPSKDGSVDPDRGFAMRWEVSADRRKALDAILAAARQAGRVVLATDPDREGEAISWHLAEMLHERGAVPLGGLARITFNAVTKDAVREAMRAPRPIDQPLVDAYRARRALDYLVGFTLSPVLWRRLPGAKSAGRVQSVALRLIVEREREIEAFRPREYWSVTARLVSSCGQPFRARLAMLDGRKLDKFALADEAAAEAARARVEASSFRVASVETRPLARNPAPPFTTSTLQQEASRKLGMGAEQTMRLAQSLYEAGHITYMRTDGVAMDRAAIEAARAAARARHGADHVPQNPRHYSTKARNAQEAHEAIRPTDFGRGPGSIGASADERRLYDLIWKRAVASQMAAARLERTTADLISEDGRIGLRATGTVLLFPGFLALYAEDVDDAEEDEEESRLPRLASGDRPALEGADKARHVTQPPPRYSEASLVKRLEELGIGRPSTYASIIQTLKSRNYVTLEQKRFRPEEQGRLVTAFLERFFERYVSYDFTAGLEEDLDRISAGDADWLEILAAFWADFRPRTEEVMQSSPMEVEQALDAFLGPHLFPDPGDGRDPRACPACGDGRLSLKVGRRGPFIACSNYPGCRYTRALAGSGEAPQQLGAHPETGEQVTLKSGRYGRYLECGDKRVSVPEDVGEPDLEMALKLLSLPREVGRHPETGEPVLAGIGRYGPYLLHAGRYANLKATEELFTIGMNRAVDLLAQPRRGRATPEALRVLGAHPDSGAEIRLMAGRFGPYVTDGAVNASLPRGTDPAKLTVGEAVLLLAERAAQPPARKAGSKRGKPAGAGKGRKPTGAANGGAPARAANGGKPARAVNSGKPARSGKADRADRADRAGKPAGTGKTTAAGKTTKAGTPGKGAAATRAAT
jgi:DNA topoisomerase-1